MVLFALLMVYNGSQLSDVVDSRSFREDTAAFHFAFSRSCRHGGRSAADCGLWTVVVGRGDGGWEAVQQEDTAALCGEEASGRRRSGLAGREEASAAAAAEAEISMGGGALKGLLQVGSGETWARGPCVLKWKGRALRSR
ncbi:unnamed protein product [Urochloa humidicola]